MHSGNLWKYIKSWQAGNLCACPEQPVRGNGAATRNGSRRRCQYNFGAAGRDADAAMAVALIQLPPCPVAVAFAALSRSLLLSLSLSLALYLPHMSSKCSATNAPQNSRLGVDSQLQLRLQLRLRLCRLPPRAVQLRHRVRPNALWHLWTF